MNVIVVGCGRVGSELAYRLFKQGHKVVVIDRSDTAFGNLPPDFRGRTLDGDVLNQDLMQRAGIAKADGLAAVTTSDATNAVLGHVAQSLYHTPHVVVRNYDPHWRSVYESFGLQVVSSASWGAQRIEEMLYESGVHTVFSAGNGEVEVYEVLIPDAWHHRSLKDLLPGDQCVAVALSRAGRAVLPAADSLLEACDVLHVSATLEGSLALRKRLGQPGRPE